MRLGSNRYNMREREREKGINAERIVGCVAEGIVIG
jgi:hypothetical protein